MEALLNLRHVSIVKGYLEMGARATFFILALVLLYKYFQGLMGKKKRPMDDEAACIDLAGHDFFAKIDVTISHVIRLQNKEKEACSIDFTLILVSNLSLFTRREGKRCAEALVRRGVGPLHGREVDRLLRQQADEARRNGIPEAFIAGFNNAQQAKIVQVSR